MERKATLKHVLRFAFNFQKYSNIKVHCLESNGAIRSHIICNIYDADKYLNGNTVKIILTPFKGDIEIYNIIQ